jgi:hypothetical protein
VDRVPNVQVPATRQPSVTALDPELAAAIKDIEAAGVPEWHQLSVASAPR